MRSRWPVIPSIVVVVVLTACSAQEGERPAPVTSPEAAAASSPAADASSERNGRLVDPRENGLDVGFGEFAITLEADEIRPGSVTFVIRNGGALVHGFEIEAEDDDGDSSGPGSGELKVEGPEFGPGDVVRIEATLPEGVYEVECFVAEHDDRGMRTTLIVRRGAPLVREAAVAEPGTVRIADFAFAPAHAEVAPGTKVTWTNDDPTAHTVTADDGAFDSGSIEPGAGFSFRLERPGTYRYTCLIHPTMRATVRVA